MNALNEAQLNILKLFQVIKSEKDIAELKQILIEYLSKKTVEAADKAYDEKGYTQADWLNWQYEHYRTETKP